MLRSRARALSMNAIGGGSRPTDFGPFPSPVMPWQLAHVWLNSACPRAKSGATAGASGTGYLHAYLDGCDLAGDRKGPLFRTIARGTGRLSDTPLPQANAYQMVRRRALAAGIATPIGNHAFRATGITAYLKNGGTLERAAAMANHASTRTTQLYDRRSDDVTLDEVERVMI